MPGHRDSEPLPYDRVMDVDLEKIKTNVKFPVNPASVVTLSTFFLLRELEVAAARIEDMMLNTELLEVKLRLSMSKNDPMAKGCERSWKCICDDITAHSHRSCPYHAALQHKIYLRQIWGDGLNDDFPLFPDGSGEEQMGDRVVDLVEAIADLCGER